MKGEENLADTIRSIGKFMLLIVGVVFLLALFTYRG